MKITLAFAVAAIMGTNTICAQTGESLDRQVDVSRDYMPTVDRAPKLSVRPVMKDTTLLRPDFDYTVTPSPMNSGFGVTALSPVSVNTVTYDPLYPFYLKLGGGFPAQSLVNFYANSTGRGNGTLGFYADHYGQYSKIKNDIGNKNKSGKMTNSLGVTGQTRIGRLVVGGELGFDYNQYSRYGQFNLVEGVNEAPVSSVKQKFMTPRVDLSVGNDFTDLTHLNFRVNAGGYYFKDDFHNVETSGRAGLELARLFQGEHKMTIRAEYEGMYGSDSLKYHKNHIVLVGARYDLLRSDIAIGLGFDFAFDIRDGYDTETIPLPSLSLSFPSVLNGKLVPYVEGSSRLETNSYRSLTMRNPYLDENVILPENTSHYDGRAGVKGSFSGVFGYRLYGGVSYLKHPAAFANYYSNGQSSTFIILQDKSLMKYVVGLELEGRMASDFSAELSAHYYSYDTKDLEKAIGLPDYDIGLKVKWNYKSKFFLTAGIEYIGDRWFAEYYEIVDTFRYVKKKPVVDINVNMEYRLNRTMGIFLSGHNLADNKLYEFYHYPGQGITVNAGVKLFFQ